VASVLLVSLLVALVAVSSARRTRDELEHQLEAKGTALAEAVVVASQSAIQGNALMEEMIARRLLDDARLVDRLLGAGPLDAGALEEIRRANGLRRIDLLDLDGRPWTPPPRPPMMPGRMMGGGAPGGNMASRHHEMMRFFWGRRWSAPPAEAPDVGTGPAALRDRRFWEGSDFGVAIGAHSFPGLVVVHADAAAVRDFRREVGVERQIADLGRQAGVAAVALLGPDLTVLAHSDRRRNGARDDAPALAGASARSSGWSRRVRRPDGRDVLEVVRPIALDGKGRGLLRIDLSTEPVQEAWRRDVRSALVLALSVLLVGGIGLGVIFSAQGRHLSEVRALEVEMERRDRLAALGNLAAVVGHEIRNPLNAVSIGLQRLRREFQPAEGAPEYARLLELAEGEVRRLNGIVEEFLSLARPLPLSPAPVAPASLVEDVAGLVEDEARERGIRLLRRVSPDLPVVQVDRDRMKEVLLNLARNALDAMPGGGTLTLEAALDRGGLRLAVEDTGEGVPPALLPRIFEPYVTSKTTGMGLGLAIARRIVEAHGARIAAESRQGAGSRFTVTWSPDGPRRG
jgi:signal transduction histidine kinase